MELAGGVVGNRRIATIVEGATIHVKEGQPLAASLDHAPFPSTATSLIGVGESTGRLPDLLIQASDLLEADVKRTIDRLMALLAPALTVLLGMVIAILVASIFSALVSINELAV
jgi:general secretion pathway protein F